MKSQIFDEDLVEVFPVHSQPKVFLRDLDNLQYRLYFGFMIPRFRMTLSLDIKRIKILMFKHGLMLLYQFLDFVSKIHLKDLRFGFLDFSNLYFLENRESQAQPKSSEVKQFSVELLFIDKNLQNLAIEQNNQVANQGYLNNCVSQSTERDQKAFVQRHIDSNFFNLQ